MDSVLVRVEKGEISNVVESFVGLKVVSSIYCIYFIRRDLLRFCGEEQGANPFSTPLAPSGVRKPRLQVHRDLQIFKKKKVWSRLSPPRL
jgi:hypothetical protein